MNVHEEECNNDSDALLDVDKDIQQLLSERQHIWKSIEETCKSKKQLSSLDLLTIITDSLSSRHQILLETARQRKKLWRKYLLDYEIQQLTDHRQQQTALARNLQSLRNNGESNSKIDRSQDITQSKKPLLPPSLISQIQNALADPYKISQLVTDYMTNSLTDSLKSKSTARHMMNQLARTASIEWADEYWTADSSISKAKMAEKIQQDLRAQYNSKHTIKTISDWITPSVPQSRKKGGRPKK